MFGRLFRRDPEGHAIATTLYGAIVAQARNPVLYTDFGVADTVTGRFEMVVLHLVLVLDRIAAEGVAEKGLGQAVFDLYCTDMDRSLRELGFGDLGVPRRMKKMAQAFYGRSATYREAIAAGDQTLLAEAISRNVFPENASQATAHVPELAVYVLHSARLLAAQPMTDIRAAKVAFAPLATSEAA